MPTNLVLIGSPGVGKGTQAALLTQRLGIVHLASGDVFRSEIAAGTPLGAQAKAFIDRGELVPDDVTISMMQGKITAPEASQRGFVLDGFPRTVAQAEALDRKLAELGIEVARVVSLEVPDDVVVSRLSGRRLCPNCGSIYHVATLRPKKDGICDKCGSALVTRSDDNEQTVRQRLEVFHRQTQPVLAYYEGTGKLFHVDGDGTSDEVYSRMTQGLGA